MRRSLDVARTVAQLQRSGATLGRVARATGLSRSTAFRLLRTLVEERLLRFDPEHATYRIGTLACELGLAAPSDLLPGEEWRKVVDAVSRQTRLTSYLMMRSGQEAVCILCAPGMAAVRAMPMEIGQRVPLGIGAGGVAILASLSDADILHVLEANAHRIGQFPSGATSREMLMERLRLCRERGHSSTSGTVAAGVSGVGVLVPSHEAIQPMAVTVSAVGDSIDEQEAAALASGIRAAIRKHAPSTCRT